MTDITLDQNSLKNLVKKFEEKEYELTDVSQEQVEQFGYPCLSHTLMFKEPKIPDYDLTIADYIKTHTFDTLDSLVSYISSLKTDINKLFGIFSFEALKVEFDTKLYFSGKYKKPSTLEEFFKTKKSVSAGYSYFFIEMSKHVKINKEDIIIQEYSTLSKTFDYDPLNLPEEIKPNHSSIYIKIKGIPFISDPTLAAGQITDSKEFKRNFNPNLFLIPLLNSICDHYPCDESQNLLPFKIPFADFFQSIKISPFEKKIKTETYPFVKITANHGYIVQTYSCISPINNVYFKIFKKESQNFKQIPSIDGITSYEVIEKKIKNHKERCRFMCYIIFQNEGFYDVEMYIDSLKILNYFVNVPQKNLGTIPVTLNYFHDSKFIPMNPSMILTKVLNNTTIIRFAVAIKRSDILWDIVKMNDQNGFNVEGEIIDRKFGRYIKLMLPFDDERYEDQLCVTFPSNGRYAVSIYLSNDEGSFSNYVKFYFDVTGADSKSPKPISPVYYMFSGRKFAPNRIFDSNKNEVTIKPNLNCYLVTEKDQTIQIKTASNSDSIHLEFKQDDKTVASPTEKGQNGEFRLFKWSIPGDYGEYHLMGWINDKQCFDLTYIYHNLIFKENSKDEKEVLDELMNKICQEDPDAFQAKKERAMKLIETEEEEEIEKKQSSKCCLLL